MDKRRGFFKTLGASGGRLYRRRRRKGGHFGVFPPPEGCYWHSVGPRV